MRVVSRACNHERLCAPGGWSATGIARALGLALWELAELADELETEDRRPTNEPLRRLD